MIQEIIKRTLRIPTMQITPGDGQTITRQLDSTLMSVGFKLSKDALEYFNALHPAIVKDTATNILAVIRELVGDHIKHNVYFIDFPNNVPDTVEFWMGLISDALLDPDSASKIAAQLQIGVINLLDLPKYGKYLHSYEDMIADHEKFIPSVKDRITILHLGKSLPEEVVTLYHSLAGSVIPLNDDDRKLLRKLTEVCLTESQPNMIPIRENKAIINSIRIENDISLIVDTPTDVLRVACALSDGDVTLLEKTKFKSFPRKIRRALISTLDKIIKNQPAKLADVNQYSEQWKRLGERLHVYEYRQWPDAQDVFTIARGDKKVCSLAARIEIAFSEVNIGKAILLLSSSPGMFFRSLDRIIRSVLVKEMNMLTEVVEKTISRVSTRVILSVREHLQNRLIQGTDRIFANRKGTAWVTNDDRPPFERTIIEKFFDIFDKNILSRIQPIERLVIDKPILEVAIPLSDKNKTSGFAIMPRGSIMPIGNKILRFFIHWKQNFQQTDYDLSAIMLDENFKSVGHLSYTNLREYDGVHSGDITEAPDGASEFIDINLEKTGCKYIVPSINVYCGESFEEVGESFFGFMERTLGQKGKPFEPATVRIKSDIRGKGKVSLPLVFIKGANNKWCAKWIHLYLNGMPTMNRIEANRISTALLVSSIVKHEYLCIEYLVELMKQKADSFSLYQGQKITDPVTFIGLKKPEGLPNGSTIFTLNNLQNLLPA